MKYQINRYSVVSFIKSININEDVFVSECHTRSYLIDNKEYFCHLI